MLQTVLLSCLFFNVLQPFGTLALHNIFKRDASSHAWNYKDERGPDHWPIMFRQCGGASQSPIDINTKEVDPNDKLDEFVFINYDDAFDDAVIENNGHTIMIVPGPKEKARKIYEGGMDDAYQFVQLHFHWGSDSKRGSEHKIDGEAFPMEMHLVHRNEDFSTMEAAVRRDGGLVVLAALFELDDEDNEALEPIIDKLDNVRIKGTKANLGDFTLQSLLPDDLMPYYRYEGSLTTPPCYEVVFWTVFKDRVPISEKQLYKFRSVMTVDEWELEEPLINNFRPVQNLYERVVQVSEGGDEKNAASFEAPTGPVVLAWSILAFFL